MILCLGVRLEVMENVTANLSGKVRRARLHGRDYLVAPLTLIVPGVLNGSKGPLYYPPDEIAKDPSAWNGIPIVVYHPEVNGAHVSARDPAVADTREIGQVFKAKSNGKLKAEGWFDVEATRRVDRRVLQSLESGKPIELSTGLFTDNIPAQNGANHKGRAYSFVARNYKPDHLAILPDQIGACSIQDGCGVLVNSDWRKRVLTRLKANSFCPTGSGGGVDPSCGKGKGGGRKKKPSDKLRDMETPEVLGYELDRATLTPKRGVIDTSKPGDYGADPLGDGKFRMVPSGDIVDYEEMKRRRGVKNAAPGQPHSKVTGKWKRPGSGVGKGDVHEAAQRGQIRLTVEQVAQGAEAKEMADEGSNPPSWVTDEAAWDKAKAAADKGGYSDDSYWAVVAHIYQNITGNSKEKAVKANANPEGHNQYTGGSHVGEKGGYSGSGLSMGQKVKDAEGNEWVVTATPRVGDKAVVVRSPRGQGQRLSVSEVTPVAGEVGDPNQGTKPRLGKQKGAPGSSRYSSAAKKGFAENKGMTKNQRKRLFWNQLGRMLGVVRNEAEGDSVQTGPTRIKGKAGVRAEATVADFIDARRRRKKLKREGVGNTFCPTGQGGGVDPSCGKSNEGPRSRAVRLGLADPEGDEGLRDLEEKGMKSAGREDNSDARRYPDSGLPQGQSFKEGDSVKVKTEYGGGRGRVVEVHEQNLVVRKITGGRKSKEEIVSKADVIYVKNQEDGHSGSSELLGNVTGEPDMAKLSDKERKKIVDNLVTCNDCGWNEDDREVLNELPDEKLTMMGARLQKEKEQEAVVNAVREGYGQKELTVNAMPAFIKEKIDAAKGKESDCVDGKDKDGKPCGDATKNKEKKVENTEKTEQDWMAQAPASVREDLAFASNEKAKQKRALVKRMTANVSDDTARGKLTEKLMAKPLDELQELSILAPPEKAEEKFPSYLGAAAPTGNQEDDDDDDDILERPVLNFKKQKA